MKTKKIIIGLAILIVMVLIYIIPCEASTDAAITAMQGIEGSKVTDSTGKLGTLINAAISLIQVAGTGLSVIMTTMLGIKYLLAAPADKADVKKQIVPLLIGCLILFSSVNLVGIIADVANTTLKVN